MKWLTLLIISLMAFAAQAQAQEAPREPQTPAEWRTLTLSDLAMIETTLRENTPFGVRRDKSEAARWLAQGAAEARRRAADVADKAGWYYTLAGFVNGFRDPHINLRASSSLPPARWPGFIALRKGETTIVAYSDPSDAGAPPVGAEIVSCDGARIDALIASRIYPFVLNDRLAIDRRRAPTRLFLDRGVPFAPPPTTCIFRHAGADSSRTLHWRALPQPETDYWTRYNGLTVGPDATIGVSEAAPGVFWIGVPTFSSGSETAPRLQALVDEVRAKAEVMRAARAIVIDVRGNGGGNTAWSDRLVEALIPADVLKRHAPPGGLTAIDWRASADNSAYFRTFLEEAKTEFGAESEEVRFLTDIVANLDRTRAAGRALWRQGSPVTGRGGGLTTRRPAGASPFPATIYILGNGTCGSTCLNFLDRMLFIPGVKLIGSASNGDTDMMEVRTVATPSGLARLTLPQKAYRGRARGSLEAYAPDIAYEGAWDDDAVRDWTLGLLGTPR